MDTRHFTQRFATGWKSRLPGAEIIVRDVGLNPPSPTNETWIAAAFSDAANRTRGETQALEESETLISELFRADAIVRGVPMYNFGVPAQLKSYLDQMVRVGRTFAFDPNAAEPYIPLIPSGPVVVTTSTGAGGYEPGGPFAQGRQDDGDHVHPPANAAPHALSAVADGSLRFGLQRRSGCSAPRHGFEVRRHSESPHGFRWSPRRRGVWSRLPLREMLKKFTSKCPERVWPFVVELNRNKIRILKGNYERASTEVRLPPAVPWDRLGQRALPGGDSKSNESTDDLV